MLDVGAQSLIDNMTTNVYGAYHAAVAFAPLLLKSKYERKSLVFLSSSFASMQLADEITAAHEEGIAKGFDATAMYNVSKVKLYSIFHDEKFHSQHTSDCLESSRKRA